MRTYRGHTRRWTVIKSLALIALSLALAAYNLWWVGGGVATGSVKALGRGSDKLVQVATDPGAFGWNLCFRSFIGALSVGAAFFLWRQLRDELRR